MGRDIMLLLELRWVKGLRYKECMVGCFTPAADAMVVLGDRVKRIFTRR